VAQIGICIIFFIVFGDVAGGLIEKMGLENTFWSSRVFTHCMLALMLLYLVLLKDIRNLRHAGLSIL
jgi:hypothetical protein